MYYKIAAFKVPYIKPNIYINGVEYKSAYLTLGIIPNGHWNQIR